MAENEILEQETETIKTEDSNKIYLDAINKLKSSTVSVDEYNKLKADNKNLLDAMLQGNATTVEKPKEKPTVEQCRKALYQPEHPLNDIEYVQRSLELREAILEETGEDCYVPKAHNYVPSEEAYKSAQRTADVFKQCIEYANGDNALFINELQRRTADVRIPPRKN